MVRLLYLFPLPIAFFFFFFFVAGKGNVTGLSRYLVKLSVESSTHAEVEESGIELGLIDPPTWILHFLFSFSY